jgi:putative aldouronate transport system permease protein
MVGRRRPTAILFSTMISILVVLMCFIFVFPFIYTIAISFSDPFYILSGQVLFYPRGFNISSYKAILSDQSMMRALFFTLRLTILGVCVNLLMTILAAFPLSRRNLRGRRFFLGIILFTWYFEGGLIPTYLLVKRLGLIDTIWSLILPEAISIYLLIITITYIRLSKDVATP